MRGPGSRKAASVSGAHRTRARRRLSRCGRVIAQVTLSPLAMSRRNPSSPPAAQHLEKVTVAEAATLCGWRRPNTFRERALRTAADRERFALEYDAAGRAVVDAVEVSVFVEALAAERARRGNWRVKNLGAHARPRTRKSKQVGAMVSTRKAVPLNCHRAT